MLAVYCPHIQLSLCSLVTNPKAEDVMLVACQGTLTTLTLASYWQYRHYRPLGRTIGNEVDVSCYQLGNALYFVTAKKYGWTTTF